MLQTITANGMMRRRFLVLIIALLVTAAALSPLAINARAGNSAEPTFTVEPLGGLTKYPDDVSATIKVRFNDGDQPGSQSLWARRDPAASDRTHVIQVRDFDNVLMARLVWDDGAILPWHTHPGPVIGTVAEGALTITNASDCVPRTYAAGEGFVDLGHGNVHMAQAVGETVTYITLFEVPDDGVATILVDDPGC